MTSDLSRGEPRRDDNSPRTNSLKKIAKRINLQEILCFSTGINLKQQTNIQINKQNTGGNSGKAVDHEVDV